jgi:predicted amidohydrolase
MVRGNAWETLLKARAIENLSYTVGVNRVGLDGNGVEYNGHSAFIGPRGDSFYSVESVEAIKTLELSAHALQAYRDKFPAFMDADDFTIEAEEFEERDLTDLS